MKRWHQINITLDSGVEFITKIESKYIDAFNEWIDIVPGVTKHEEIRAIAPIRGHSSKKTKIAIARMAAGYTQQEMADKLGVRIQQYQRWEYGTFVVKTADLIRIGEALDVDWTTLIEEQ